MDVYRFLDTKAPGTEVESLRNPSSRCLREWARRSLGVHPKTETEKMVTVLEKENACHKRKRSSQSTQWS
jgi:hypothetical protein